MQPPLPLEWQGAGQGACNTFVSFFHIFHMAKGPEMPKERSGETTRRGLACSMSARMRAKETRPSVTVVKANTWGGGGGRRVRLDEQGQESCQAVRKRWASARLWRGPGVEFAARKRLGQQPAMLGFRGHDRAGRWPSQPGSAPMPTVISQALMSSAEAARLMRFARDAFAALIARRKKLL